MVRYFLSFFLLIPICLFGQGLEGKITNKKGEPVSFANIYVPALKNGTTSNADGIFKLHMPAGNYRVQFQYLGYETKTVEVVIGEGFQTLDIVLKQQNYRLPELKVMASGEDPAYYIMRKAIGMAPYYRKQVSEYNCRVYLKGTGVFTKIPKLLKKQLEKEGLEKGKAFVMETISDIHYKLPDELDQTVVAMRSSGADNNTSPMQMITSNLYNARDYDMIGPVDAQALSAYNFQLEGSFEDGGRTVNKIKMTPKRKGNDLFEGYIYIADDYWNIHSADLSLSMPMVEASVRQLYAPVDENVWMPVSLNFDVNFKGFGMGLNYKYVASINDYKTTMNPDIDHKDILKAAELNREKLAVEDSLIQTEKAAENAKLAALLEKEDLSNRDARKLQRLMEKEVERDAPPESLEIKENIHSSSKAINNDSAFWATIRPIPLSENENVSFKDKDSVVQVAATPEYRDSIRNERRKFKVKYLGFGKTYNYSTDSINTNRYFTTPGLINIEEIGFNTVDGLRLGYEFRYTYSDSTGKRFRLEPYLGYAFSRNVLDAFMKVSYRLNGMNHATITINGGKRTVDFNEKYSMPELLNMSYTLFYQENYKKYYSKTFGEIAFKKEVLNGCWLDASATYAERNRLYNNTDFTFIDYDKEFTLNTPVNEEMEDWQVEDSRLAEMAVGVQYTPKHRYKIRNGIKYHVGARYPTFHLNYEKAFGLDETYANFDFVSAGIHQSVSIGLMDNLSYNVKAGGFVNHEKVYFPDFKHFNTNEVLFTLNSDLNRFSNLPYYQASTQKYFVEAHVAYESQRLLVKRLPFLGNTLITEQLRVNYLNTQEFKNYTEWSYGLHNVFLMLNLEVNTSFLGTEYQMTGFKVGMNF